MAALGAAVYLVGRLAAGGAWISTFESGAEGWRVERPREAACAWSRAVAREGVGALAVRHRFGPGLEVVEVRKEFETPLDFSREPGFVGFRAWVHFGVGTDHWEAQLAVHSGDTWEWSEGPLVSGLSPGWHRVEIWRDGIFDVSEIHAICVLLKNFAEEIECTAHVDAVEAVIVSDRP